VDLSPDIGRDIASDKALAAVLENQMFYQERIEYFDFAFYWQSIEEMKADLEENWKDETIITEEIWSRAAELLTDHKTEKKLRLAVQMKLGVYKKEIRS
jgi:hypothetical protein